jgi:two-component system NtrC family sensor kinase
MGDTLKGENLEPQKNAPLRINEWLLRAKATNGLRSHHFWIISGLLAAFGYIYYGVLTAYYDVYVVLFFYPLIYAAIVYRLRGVVITGLVFLGILLPHALLFTHETYSLIRSLLFALFAFLISGFGATLLNYLEMQVEAYKEIMSLNRELNDYIERLESTQKQLIQAEKMNAIGQLAASVAHEINNPLAGVLVYSKLLAKKMGGASFDKEEALNNLSKIELAVNHCSRIIRSLLDFSRQSEPVLKPLQMADVIDQVMFLVGHQAEMKKVAVVREEVASLPLIMGDSGQLQQVFINLVVNAIQAMPDGGTLVIKSSAAEDGWVSVSVHDTGHGITPENMNRLFTPFFTTKDEVKGVGLGLAVSYGIVERHGGRIEVQSEVGQGSTFTVFLPVPREEKPPG